MDIDLEEAEALVNVRNLDFLGFINTPLSIS